MLTLTDEQERDLRKVLDDLLFYEPVRKFSDDSLSLGECVLCWHVDLGKTLDERHEPKCGILAARRLRSAIGGNE